MSKMLHDCGYPAAQFFYSVLLFNHLPFLSRDYNGCIIHITNNAAGFTWLRFTGNINGCRNLPVFLIWRG
jgi:hypothetical protein